MILFERQEIVLLTPPKTASKALMHLLCHDPFEGLACIGPTPNPGHYDHHTVILPTASQTWKTYYIVRNPIDRLVSLWGHFVRWQTSQGLASPSLNEFCVQIARRKHPFYLIQWTLSEIIGKVPHTPIKCEAILKELASIGLIGPDTVLPKIDTLESWDVHRPNWRKSITKETLSLLKPWWVQDCDKFEYPYPEL